MNVNMKYLILTLLSCISFIFGENTVVFPSQNLFYLGAKPFILPDIYIGYKAVTIPAIFDNSTIGIYCVRNWHFDLSIEACHNTLMVSTVDTNPILSEIFTSSIPKRNLEYVEPFFLYFPQSSISLINAWLRKMWEKRSIDSQSYGGMDSEDGSVLSTTLFRAGMDYEQASKDSKLIFFELQGPFSPTLILGIEF